MRSGQKNHAAFTRGPGTFLRVLFFWGAWHGCGVASFQQNQANKCDEVAKAGGFGGAVTHRIQKWVMHTKDGITKK